jgi:DUF971 family protein
MTDRSLRCVAVRSPEGGRETVIEWADGHISAYPHALLRGYCPCAGCQGHGSGLRFVESADYQQELQTIEPVGNYGLSFTWFDGHSSGIYAYRYLRALCPCATCKEQGAAPGLSR